MSSPASFLHSARWLAVVAFVLVASIAVVSAPTERSSAAVGAERKPAGLVICEVFGDRYCAQALRVVWCESRFDTNARNGQYLGAFQMGSWERSKYGHGSTIRAQARAAHRYFVATGKTWRPWSCKPWGAP